MTYEERKPPRPLAEAHGLATARDAARYHWLRRFDHFASADALLDTADFNTLDAAVDYLMAKESAPC